MRSAVLTKMIDTIPEQHLLPERNAARSINTCLQFIYTDVNVNLPVSKRSLMGEYWVFLNEREESKPALCEKCPEITSVVTWCYVNKTEFI